MNLNTGKLWDQNIIHILNFQYNYYVIQISFLTISKLMIILAIDFF